MNRGAQAGRPHHTSRGRPLGPAALVLVVALVAASGCAPSRMLARAIVKAPNTYPDWLGPAASVELAIPASLATGWTSEAIAVGPPPARLWVTCVAPGDYQARIRTSPMQGGRRPGLIFSLRAKLPPQPTAATAAPRGTVFLLHGHGVDSFSLWPWAVVLAEAGYQAVLVDLRGHGDSTGKRVYFGAVEGDDLRQVLDDLMAQGKVRGPVAAMGESLGGVMALRWGAVDPRVKAVVALAPYAELGTAILAIRDEYARWLPRRLVQAAARRLPGELAVPPASLDTEPFVTRSITPTLLVAAGHDPIAPPLTVGRLARLCAGPVKYLAVMAARHETLPYHLDELREPVLGWLEAYASAPSDYFSSK
ncbi:MAG: alpha/beta fold hydrolase [Verrucomicrobiales bacterium]|nr:alpha/beta fold hydrolase [Verrucomicrobiales bacterium]